MGKYYFSIWDMDAEGAGEEARFPKREFRKDLKKASCGSKLLIRLSWYLDWAAKSGAQRSYKLRSGLQRV
jgi:hypothetical protein